MKTRCETWLSQGRMTWGCLGLWISSVLCAPFAWAQAPANLPSRIEYHAFASATTTGEEFLLGQKGKEVALSGELRLPQGGRAKFPAVVLIHGSGGIGPAMDVWTHQLNQAGFATFVVDSFTGRGIVSTGADQTQLHSLSMTIDAYRALDLLAKHPRVDADKIAVLGFSKGALGAIFSASTRFKSLHGSGRTFAAHLGLYTPCNTRFMGDTAVTGKPMTSELLTLDNDAKSAAKDFLNLGYARRAWQFTGLSNDRDRPALSMPKTQAILDVLAMFEADPDTDLVVMVGEIGGSDEEDCARWVKANMKKPVIGFIAGLTAPPGKRMGHAGAIISGGKGTAQSKLEVMEECGIKVTRNPAEMGKLMKSVLK